MAKDLYPAREGMRAEIEVVINYREAANNVLQRNLTLEKGSEVCAAFFWGPEVRDGW